MKKILHAILVFLTILSCQSTQNDCISIYDNVIPKTIDDELISAKKIITENIDSLHKWNAINTKLEHQNAGVLANIGLWNLIDGAYLESITIKNENLILFEFGINSCAWKKEFIIYNSERANYNQIFKNLTVRVDSIIPNWSILRIKNQNESGYKN